MVVLDEQSTISCYCCYTINFHPSLIAHRWFHPFGVIIQDARRDSSHQHDQKVCTLFLSTLLTGFTNKRNERHTIK